MQPELDRRVNHIAEGRLGPVLGFMRALWELDHALESASRRMRPRLGVTGPERLVVRIVGELPGISPGELATIMHLDPSSLTGILKRLVRRKLLARSVDATDTRRSHLKLTDRGRSVDRLRSGTVESAVRNALSGLPARDVASSRLVLRTLARSLAALSVSERASAAPRRRARRS